MADRWGPDNILQLLRNTDKRISILERKAGSGGDISYNLIRLTSAADLSLTSTDHAFQIGPDDGANLAMDSNEVMARSNGAPAILQLNAEGGVVGVNGSTGTSAIYFGDVVGGTNAGRIRGTHYPWAVAAGSISGTVTAGTPSVDTITFPAGRFTVAPNITIGRSGNNSLDIDIITSSISTTGFTLTRTAGGTGTRTVRADWLAIQMTPTSAGG